METTREKSNLRLLKSPLKPGLAHTRPAPAPVPMPGRSDAAYTERMGAYAQRIRGTDNVTAIIDILDQALTETRALEGASGRPFPPAKLEQAELEIHALKAELERLRGLVYVDHLTGLLNRAGLKDHFSREAACADRSGKALAIALLDIDDFKVLNDHYGHQAGDDALVHLARTIHNTMRPSDILVRYGGEEFLFLLPGSTVAQATQALQRLQYELHAQPLTPGDAPVALSFSAGIAIRDPHESFDAVMARADHALYTAKRAGKCQVCAAPESAQKGPP